MSSRTATIDARYCPGVKGGLAGVQIAGESVIYAPDTDALHHLDGTATAVWTLANGRTTLGAMAATLAERYAADESQVLDDVVELTESLWRRGLLEGSAAAEEFVGTRAARSDASPTPFAVPLEAVPPAPLRSGTFSALAHRFEIATNVAGLDQYLDDVFRDLRVGDGAKGVRYDLLSLNADDHILACDGEVIADAVRLDRALATLAWHINAEAVRTSVGARPVLHAAAATHGDIAVLLPAPPESGKTTVVAGLVRAGFGYLTDEAVPIDPATLLPGSYPKALSIDRGSWEVLADLRPVHAGQITGQWQVPATSIRPGAVGTPAPVRVVVVPRYRSDATTVLEPISRTAMLVRLADSTFQFPAAAQRNLDVLARLLDAANCYELTYRDVDEAVATIADVVGSEQLDITE